MKIRELIRYSRRRLNGRRREFFLVCSLPIGAELLFRALESALYSLFLYFSDAEPIRLFTGNIPELLGISAVFAALRLAVCPSLWCAAAVRLREFTENLPYTSFPDMLLSGKFLRRSISAAVFGRITAIFALIPAVVSAGIAAEILSSGTDSAGIFAASNALAVTAASALLWVSVRLTLLAVPWVLAAHPEKGGISTVFTAFRFTAGRRSLPVKLALVYFPAAVTIVGIPFIIPEISASYCQGLSIFMKEDEYAAIPEKRLRRRFLQRRKI